MDILPHLTSRANILIIRELRKQCCIYIIDMNISCESIDHSPFDRVQVNGCGHNELCFSPPSPPLSTQMFLHRTQIEEWEANNFGWKPVVRLFGGSPHGNIFYQRYFLCLKLCYHLTKYGSRIWSLIFLLRIFGLSLIPQQWKKEKVLFYKLHRVHATQLIKAIREDNAFQAGEKTSNFFYICVWPDLSNPYQGGAILSTFNPH